MLEDPVLPDSPSQHFTSLFVSSIKNKSLALPIVSYEKKAGYSPCYTYPFQNWIPDKPCSPISPHCCALRTAVVFFFFLLYLNLTCFWTVATAADSKWKARAFPWGPWGRQWLSRGAAPIQQEAHQNLPEEEGGAAHDTKMGSLGTCRSTSHPQGKGKENTLLNMSNKLHSWHEVALGKKQPWKKTANPGSTQWGEQEVGAFLTLQILVWMHSQFCYCTRFLLLVYAQVKPSYRATIHQCFFMTT